MHFPITDILKLSIPERIHIVEEIWDSIEKDSKQTDDLYLSENQKNILMESLESYKRNPKKGYSLEDVKAFIASRKKDV